MGFAKSVLAADERLVLHSHPHWKTLIWPIFVLLFGSAVAPFLAAVVVQQHWDRSAEHLVVAMIAAIWLVVVGWLTVLPLLSWRATHLVVTDRRVVFRYGVLTRSGIVVPLARINSVEYRHGLFDRMWRIGTLVIESASQDPLEFCDIPRVKQVHALLYHEVFDTFGADESGTRAE